MKKVMIRIKGTQGTGDDVSVTEFMSEGTLKRVGEKTVISYFDNAVLDNQSIKTVLTANGEDSITLERTGAIRSKLFIQKGSRNNCYYSVPEGNLTLGIYGKEIENSMTASGGRIKMTYTLDTDMRLISENTVEISIETR